MDALRDKKLVADIVAGKRYAFVDLFHYYWEPLFLYIVKVLKNEDDAEDILQDVFMKVWEQRTRLGHIQSIKAYLFTMARHGALRFVASSQQRYQFLDQLEDFFGEMKQETGEGQLVLRELHAVIDSQVQQLPKRMREVFLLSRRDNLSHREIAEQLAISEKTVKKQMNYALKSIRAKLRLYKLITIILFFLFFSTTTSLFFALV